MSKKFLPLAAAALFLSSLSAQAEGLYLGVSVGDSNFQQPGSSTWRPGWPRPAETASTASNIS